MTRATTAKKLAKNTLLYLGLALAVIAAIPLLAGLAYGVRLLIPLLLVAAVVAVAASPSFRRWFMGEADNSPHFHGVAFPTASLWVHPAHGWANVGSKGEANIGIDALALTALGPLTAIHPLAPGAQVKQGQTLFTLVRGERRLEVKTPLSGTVADVNQQVLDKPDSIGGNPYGSGWVVRLESVELDKDRAGLRRGSAMRHWWREEVERFTQRLGAGGPAPTMADGGVLSRDVASHIDDTKWNAIAIEFFGQASG
jgi:glycine cleavage system H protein